MWEELFPQTPFQEKILSYLSVEDAVNLRISRTLRNWVGKILVYDKNFQIFSLTGLNSETILLAKNLKQVGSRDLLVSAAKDKDFNLVKTLVQTGASVNCPNFYLKFPLATACKQGALEIVDFLIQQGANVNQLDSGEKTPIYSAITSHSIPILKLLIQTGATIDPNQNLFYASKIAKSGNVLILKYFETLGLNMSIDFPLGFQTLRAACRRNQLPIIKYLMSQETQTSKFIFCRQMLFNAIESNSFAIVQYLCKLLPSNTNYSEEIIHAIRLDKVKIFSYLLQRSNWSDFYCQLLCLAVTLNRIKILKLLIALNDERLLGILETSTGRNGLMIAAANNSVEIFVFLFENFRAKFNLSETDRSGMTAATLALQNCCSPRIVEFLISQKIDLLAGTNFPNPYCLFLVRYQNFQDVKFQMEILIKAGYDLNVGPFSQKPLILALVNGLSYIFTNLLENGADGNIANELNQTPLMMAVRSGSLCSVENLLESGVNVNAVDQRGESALFWAVRTGSIRMVEFLLKYGADYSRINQHGQNSKTLAKTLGYSGMIQIFNKFMD